MQGTSVLGTRVRRVEDPKLLTTGGTYGADLDIPGAAVVAYARSSMAHARIVDIDTSVARAMPGVLGVFTADDLGLAPLPPLLPFMDQRLVRPRLAHGVVRYVGDPVVAVVAETATQAADAADAVMIEYDPLPVVVDAEQAVAPDAPVLFPESGTNVAAEVPSAGPADFTGCDVVVEQRIVNSKMAPVPLEPRASAARWEDDGRLTVWACTQVPHMTRTVMAMLNGLEESSAASSRPTWAVASGPSSGSAPRRRCCPCWPAWWVARCGGWRPAPSRC